MLNIYSLINSVSFVYLLGLFIIFSECKELYFALLCSTMAMYSSQHSDLFDRILQKLARIGLD